MKVFVTVGSMLPFDRLVQAMDDWAKEHPEISVAAQIGKSKLRPANMEWFPIVDSSVYLDHFLSSDVIVAHAGMGTFITALEHQKPLVMLPRRVELLECTSNHQLATANWLKHCAGVEIVLAEGELANAVTRSLQTDGVSMTETGTRAQLISAIRQFIAG